MSKKATKYCRIFCFFLFLIGFNALAASAALSLNGQNSSDDRYTISLLTCGPGQDLYSIFGHSAVRVQDHKSRKDIVYNYGIFDFDEPGFMWKFLRGKLNYKLGVTPYNRFVAAYKREGRSVSENKILLTNDQESALVDAIQINYLPENRYYLYDFYYDNCATRIRDIIEDNVDSIHTGYGNYENRSYRKTLDLFTCPYFPWTDLGMDLILGRTTDVTCDARGSMYLPDYLQLHLENYRTDLGPLLGPRSTVLAQRAGFNYNYLTHPLLISILLYIIFGLLSKYFPHHKAWNVIDRIVLILFSIIGCIFLFMHFGTDHVSTRYNLNIIWALPFLWCAFFYFNRNNFWKWITIYYYIIVFVVFLLQGGPLSLAFFALIPALIGLRRGWWNQIVKY